MSDRTHYQGYCDGQKAAVARQFVPQSVRDSNTDYDMGFVDGFWDTWMERETPMVATVPLVGYQQPYYVAR